MKRFLVIGDSGLLGQTLVQKLGGQPECEILGVSSSAFHPTSYWKQIKASYRHQIMDLSKPDASLASLFDSGKPDVVINCAALADIGECEKKPDLAKQLNLELPLKLADLALKRSVYMMHFSTDQVFDGTKGVPYQESDPTNPVHLYGLTKRDGELAVKQANPKALVARINLVGFRDRGKHTFGEWLIHALVHKEPITLFEDFVTSSLHVDFMCDLIVNCVQNRLPGLYHLAAHNGLSKYAFGQLLSEYLSLDFSNVTKARLEGSFMKPPRPSFLALDVTQAETVLGKQFPTGEDTVRRFAEDARLRYKEALNARC